MDPILERCCGLDVHRDSVVACCLTGALDHRPKKEIRSFSTMSKGLYELLEWLEQKQITDVAMESTGVYWKPVYTVLEDYFDLKVANAQRIKNVPGRKTDISDAEWIAKLLRSGLISGSFVPPQDIRELRELTRYRKKLVSNASAEKNRILKLLESAGIKLSSVISDVFGVSGRALLLQLLRDGRLDEASIQSLVAGSIKSKVPQILDALHCKLSKHQRFLLQQSWDHLSYLELSIKQVDEAIDEHLLNYKQEMNLLLTIPGVEQTAAAAIIAEIGTDMSQFFSECHLASWAGLSPGNNESAGKKKSSRTPNGNPHVKSILSECAWAASRSKKTYLATKYWKLAARRGKKKALVAVAHKILTIIYFMLKRKQPYIDLGEDYLDRFSQEVKARKLVNQLKLMGYHIQATNQPLVQDTNASK